MNQTKEEQDQMCRKLHKLDRWYGILTVTGACLILMGLFVFDSLTVSFIGIIPTLIAILFVAPRIRCPYCGRSIRMKFGLPSHCPHCGKTLSR